MNYAPHGVLHLKFFEKVNKPRIPVLWAELLDDGLYQSWVEDSAKLLSDELWPRWIVGEERWDGQAMKHMDALTEFDLDLMGELLKHFGDPVSGEPDAPTHQVMFDIEDGRGGDVGDHLKFYHPAIDFESNGFFASMVFATGKDELVGSTTMLLKSQLQRPRAHQVVMQRGDRAFLRYYAATADSPSMISGHCFEGILGGAWLAMRYQQWFGAASWSLLEPILQRWSMDVGDRRVMAQVHYPSDNIGSWWMALATLEAMAPMGKVEDIDPAWMLDFVKRGIRQSRVYNAICAGPTPPCNLWNRLQQKVGC